MDTLRSRVIFATSLALLLSVFGVGFVFLQEHDFGEGASVDASFSDDPILPQSVKELPLLRADLERRGFDENEIRRGLADVRVSLFYEALSYQDFDEALFIMGGARDNDQMVHQFGAKDAQFVVSGFHRYPDDVLVINEAYLHSDELRDYVSVFRTTPDGLELLSRRPAVRMASINEQYSAEVRISDVNVELVLRDENGLRRSVMGVALRDAYRKRVDADFIDIQIIDDYYLQYTLVVDGETQLNQVDIRKLHFLSE